MNDVCAWLQANGSSCLELIGFISGALCVWLVTRESVWNWPLALVTSVSYAIVFARTGLYSDTGLQVVYLLLSVYGWWHWVRGDRRAREREHAKSGNRHANSPGAPTDDGAMAAGAIEAAAAPPLIVTTTPRAHYPALLLSGVAMWLLFWTITSRIPGTRAPLLDSALVAISLVAQYLMTRKYVENWMLWIGVDVVYIGLYFTRGLRLTALLYAVYLILAIIGLIEWQRSHRRNRIVSFASS